MHSQPNMDLWGGGRKIPTKPRSHIRISRRRKTSVRSLYHGDTEFMNEIKQKAKALQQNLSKDRPSFIKHMHPCHVEIPFALNLPKEFSDKYMAMAKQLIYLEDDNGEVYDVRAWGRSLGSGWRDFSIDHKLVPGDVLVFQLVSAAKFKVYIARKKDSEQVTNGGGGLGSMKPYIVKPQSQVIDIDEDEENSDTNKCENIDDRDDAGTENGSYDDFKQVKGIEDFNIVAKGVVINSKLPELVRLKYYELCRSQNSFLHQCLRLELTPKMVACAIADTVNIADAIRGFNAVGGGDLVETWRTELEGLENLGMKVDFLLVRLRKLVEICDEANRYRELRSQRAAAEAEVRNLEAKLGEAKGRLGELNNNVIGNGVDGLMEFEGAFKDLANAPW